MKEFGVNHADIISDMITSWSGTSETIWSPLPALHPWGDQAFAGLVGNCCINTSGKAELLLLLKRPERVRNGWRHLSVLAEARKILTYTVLFPSLIKYIFIVHPHSPGLVSGAGVQWEHKEICP